MGDALPFVDFGMGTAVKFIAAGEHHNCAVFEHGHVKCWGQNVEGQLGLEGFINRGDDPSQMGEALPIVELGTGRTAKYLTAGVYHTCALLDNGQVKCWGHNSRGQLGLGDQNNRGHARGTMGDDLPAVDLGGNNSKATFLGATFGGHTCAILEAGKVKCWGENDRGQLGLGDKKPRGFIGGQMGHALPFVDLGVGRSAKFLAAGHEHTCALLDNGQVKCWGDNKLGQLGLGDKDTRGDSPGQMGDSLPAVDLGKGRTAKSLAAGYHHNFALLDNGQLKHWGFNDQGQLGLGDVNNRGDSAGEMGDLLPTVNLLHHEKLHGADL